MARYGVLTVTRCPVCQKKQALSSSMGLFVHRPKNLQRTSELQEQCFEIWQRVFYLARTSVNNLRSSMALTAQSCVIGPWRGMVAALFVGFSTNSAIVNA